MTEDILIIMGSKSDEPVGKKATKVLKELGISYKLTVASAHRTPKWVEHLVETTEAKVFITIAGLAAALPGAVASHTIKPVIGVPVSGKVNLDSILAIVQMPPGIPVGGVGLDRGDNAALLAAQILALYDNELAAKLKDHRVQQETKVRADAESYKEE